MSASKEKLKFNIGGKVVSYEGRPDSREKDLFAILIKMKLDKSAAVQAFRDNIPDSANYTDNDIKQRYEAQCLLKEKKKGKSSDTPSANKGGTEKMTLIINGKRFSYDGQPDSKKQALISLLIKEEATLETAVEAFRENLPDCTATDNEIWAMIEERRQAKAATRLGLQDVFNEGELTSYSLGYQPGVSMATGVNAIDEIANMSAEQRDSISNFIKQVLEEPEADSTGGRQDGQGRAFMGVDDDALATSRTTRGKIPIYCQEEKGAATKVLYISPTTTFDEFNDMVTKKFGMKMAISFYEGDDVVDMDDDDVFCMFLEASQARMNEGKRMKLLCVPPESRKKAEDDKMTDIKGGKEYRVKAYSNGKLVVREEKTFVAHTSAVYCCSFSPNGDRFCTASRDRSVRLWNTANGSCTVMKGGHNGFVLSCNFSPRGNRIVSSSDDRTIKVWNTATCSKVLTLKGHDDKVYCVEYNPSGDYIVSASCDHTVRVWNAESGSKVATLRSHTLAVFSCCFSNTDSGKYVVSGGDDRLIKVWDWAKDDEFRSMPGHIDTVWSCRFSHDDTRIVTASMNHEIRLWNWRDGSCTLAWRAHKVPIHQVLFSANDKYIYSCARDWTVMVWNAANGEHYETIPGHHSTVYHMDISGNKLLTSSLDDTLKLWTITEKE